MKELHLSIVSPEKSIFDGDVKIVTLPGRSEERRVGERV